MAKKNMKGNKRSKKNTQKKSATEDQSEKPPVVNNRNLKFKNKNKKKKVVKKLKQVQKNENRANFLSSDVVKVVNVKKKGKDKKVVELIQNKKGKDKKVVELIQNKKGKDKKVVELIQNKKGKGKTVVELIQNKGKQEFNNSKRNKKKGRAVHQNKTNQGEKSVNKRKSKQKPEMNKEADRKTAKLNALIDKKLKLNQQNRSKKKDDTDTKRHRLDVKKLEKMLADKNNEMKKKLANNGIKKKLAKSEPQPLRHRMMSKLRSSRFRYLNETLYNNESSESKKLFKNDPDAFRAYHEGYKQQVEQWPLNPLDVIISSIKKMPKDHVIADFGCGEGALAASVPHKVHSFDFVSLNKNVTVCDVAHTPLLTNGVNVVVFCLSLMGTNLNDYIKEANRVLKINGILKIAEVESRFDQVDDFIKAVSSYGFKCSSKDLSRNLFYFLDFVKVKDLSGKKNKLLPITLKPCLYKKR